ncbi:MAG TPA: hypothetical protein VJW94_18480 [Candidatus Acidoferrum sp.]|nr:hypothetical protein [Candidatus Acidoferrum sp.]
MFKQIEADLKTAEDDPELYNVLMLVRTKLKEVMEVRARELGKSDDWALAMKGHDALFMLRPVLRILDRERDPAPEDAQKYIDAHRVLSAEQRDALQYCESIGGIHLPRPEVLEAELRWNSIRRGSILRLIPNPGLARTWYERFIAILPGLMLAVGLAFAIENEAWATALVLLVLFSVVVGTWTRDFVSFTRRFKNLS